MWGLANWGGSRRPASGGPMLTAGRNTAQGLRVDVEEPTEMIADVANGHVGRKVQIAKPAQSFLAQTVGRVSQFTAPSSVVRKAAGDGASESGLLATWSSS